MLVALVFPTRSRGESCIDYGDYIHWVGGVDTPAHGHDVVLAGGYAYVADYGSGLQVIDVSNPANPTIVGSRDTPGAASGVAVAGGYAYVAQWGGGLQVIDVLNPVNPAIVGSLDTPGWAYGVAVAGGYAYVADGPYYGLQVIDISNPANPMIVGSRDTPGEAKGVAVSGGYAYVADGLPGLQVIDISNPANPMIVGSRDMSSDAFSVAVAGGYAYVVHYSSPGGFHVIDISNPVNPVIVGSPDTPISGTDVAVAGAYAYIINGSNLQVIDVSNAANPVTVGSAYAPGAYSVALGSGYAYVAASTAGLHVINVSNPASPAIIGSRDTPYYAIGVTVADYHAYVADRYSLQVIDVSNPANPVIVGSLALKDAFDVAVDGYAYVADGPSGLQVIDISNPANPMIVGNHDTPGGAQGIAVAGSYAYVADYTSLQVIDVSNPTTPVIVGSLPGGAYGIAVAGDYAYIVADYYSGGLQVIDISNPANPMIVGSLGTPSAAYGVAVAGGHAYVAKGIYGLQVIDVSNPANPVVVGSRDTPDNAFSVAIAGGYAYVGDGYSGLQVIDVSNPTNPVIVGNLRTSYSYACDVAVAGGYAYVADGYSGLQILPGQCGCVVSAPLAACRPAGSGLLFGAQSTTDATMIPPGDPYFFNETTITLTKQFGERFYLSGAAASLADWICDDKVYVNGANAGLGFSAILDPNIPLCTPIEDVLAPVTARDITTLVPMGTNCVEFKLADTQRQIYGNTDLYLVKGPNWTTLVAPADGADISATVEFAWQDLSGARAYQVALAPNPTMADPVWSGATTTGSSLSYAISPEFPAGATYYWSVRTLFDEGWGPYAPSRSIHRLPPGGPLAAPILFAPANGAEVDLPEEFSWSLVTGATRYEIQTAATSGFFPVQWTTLVQGEAALASAFAGPNLGQTYFWRVRALAAGQESPWTPAASFIRVGSTTPPGAPKLLSPDNGAPEPGPSVAFAWEPGDRATSYTLYISKTPFFLPWATTKIPGIHGTSRIVPLSPSTTTFYWNVKGRNAGGEGPGYSPSWSFNYNRTAAPLASCTILAPSAGATIPLGAVVLGRALVAGSYTGPVTVEWFLDDVSFAQSVVAMAGQGFETPVVQVPTSALGDHTLLARASGPSTAESPPVHFTVITRTHGPAARVALAAERTALEAGQETTLYVRVVDTQGRLVESDNGRSITLSVQGGGTVWPQQISTSAGQGTADYTAPVAEGDAMVTAASGVLQSALLPLAIRAGELPRLKVEAHAYLDRLGGLRWDYYDFMLPVGRSLNVNPARALVDNAELGDEQRIRRLNMFLRVVDRSWYHDPEKHHYGPREPRSPIPGAQVLNDDCARSMGHVAVVILGSLSRLDAFAERHPAFAAAVRGLRNTLMWSADQAVGLASRLLPTDERRLVMDYWTTMKESASRALSDHPGEGLTSLLANVSVRVLLATDGAWDFVNRAQPYLDHVVTALSMPGWSGGDDSPAASTIEQTIYNLYDSSTEKDRDLNQTIERFGMTQWITGIEGALGQLGGLWSLFRVGELLNRAIESVVVWAAGVDCQTIALWISGPGHMGAAADAVVMMYPTPGKEAAELRALASLLETRVVSGGLTPLATSRAAEATLMNASNALAMYELALRELEGALFAGDSSGVRAALDSLVNVQLLAIEGWGRLGGRQEAASSAARVTYPDFVNVTDSLGTDRASAISSGIFAISIASDWLATTGEEAQRLLAQSETRRAIDEAVSYQENAVDLIVDMFSIPADAYLHADIPRVPQGLAGGESGTIHTVLRNLGAATAHNVDVGIAADSMQLSVLEPSILTADSLSAGDSLVCTWQIVMLESRGELDSSLVILGSVSPAAMDAIGMSTSFLVSVLPGGTLEAPEPQHAPGLTTVGAIFPNPSRDRHLIEVLVAPGQPAGALRIYDVTGRLVRRFDLSGLAPGSHMVAWDGQGIDGRALPSSVYVLEVETPAGRVHRKIVRVK